MSEVKGEKDRFNFIIVGIVAIVAIVGIVVGFSGMKKGYGVMGVSSDGGASESDLAGEAYKSATPKPVYPKTGVYCEDSDYGWNMELKGTTSLKKSIKGGTTLILQNTDRCESQKTGTYLREYYCVSSNKMSSLLYQCYYGCSDGACVIPSYKQAVMTCWDGYQEKQGSEGCVNIYDWYAIGDKVCSGHCSKEKDYCGLNYIEFNEPCFK